jgi:ribulose-phosphate 3-epimerase
VDRFLIAPSILSADFANLEREVTSVTEAGADFIHVDVMDGHFVPNITIGAPVVKCLRRVTRLPLDVHLMINEPERYIDDFIAAGANYLTIHVESTLNPKQCLERIRRSGVKPGITMRPATPLTEIVPFLGDVDLVLIMTVNPGFGGQAFMMDQVEKISALRRLLEQRGLKPLIEVDGGINADTACAVRAADVLVAGSYIFNHEYGPAIQRLKDAKHD